jgi:hypothetical protein
MFKIIAIVLSTLLIATFQIEAASAGCGGGHHRAFNTYQSKKPAKVAYKPARSKKPQAVAVAKPKKAVEQASATEATATATLNEKTANANSTEVSDDNVTVAAIENTCTKFIAETGTTVTVECAKQ